MIMKTITKTATVTTERGTVVNMTTTTTRGFEMVNEELFNDGYNSTVKKAQVTEKTETILTIKGVEYNGYFSVLSAREQKEKGVYCIFYAKQNCGFSQVVYDILNTAIAGAKAEAETDQSWIDYRVRLAVAEAEEIEYYKNYNKVSNAMTLNGHSY